MISYSNQIANLIAQHLPRTQSNIGDNYEAVGLEFDSNKVVLEFSDADYEILSGIINDSLKPNDIFTITGIYLKNQITEFKAYPEDALAYYGFLVKFSLPHKYVKDDIITLSGFVDTSYNISYKVLRVEDSYRVIIYPITSVAIASITSGIGYDSVEYTEGLNGIKQVSDEGSNRLSFEFDEDEMFVVSSVEGIDLSRAPLLTSFVGSLKVMNAQVFFRNLVDPTNKNYLIIDSSSLVGTPIRSQYNKSDAPYSTFGRSGHFDKNYSINVLFLLERNSDDSDNQTSSGSDIDAKQIQMHDDLTSILRQPLESDSSRVISSLTITGDSVSQTILEGRVVITYQINFSVSFKQEIMLKIDPSNSYPINSVKVNNDVVDFS